MSQAEPGHRPRRLHEAAWPDMFSNLQTAYAELAQAQFELQERTVEIVQTRDLFQRVIVSMSEVLFLVDETGQVITTNPAAAALLGRPESELVGRPFTAVASGLDIPTTPWQLLEVAPGGTLTVDAELPRPGGEAIALSVSCTTVRDTRGKLIGMLVIGRDVSVQRRAERERAELLDREQAARREAEDANRAKDLFLATLSHELRTPLNAMFGWVRMLRAGSLDASSTERALETIERNMRLQTQLIDDLLDVSRIVAGKVTLSIAAVDFPAIVEAAIDTVRAAATAKGVRIERRFDGLPAPVSGDGQRLQQIAWNLLSNAIKFTPRGGVVRIRVAAVDDHAELTVSDTGIGIAPEFLPFVFDRFRQADASTTRAYGGLGLGLAIVRHLVDLHGGTVHAESEGVGRGATFRVRLPLVLAIPVSGDGGRQAGDAETAPRGQRPLAGLRILVVEDTADERALLEVVLARAGASVTAVGSLQAGITAFERGRPDLIISDISMPGGDGYAFIRRVRALEAGRAVATPAVALTALASPDDSRHCLAAGFQRHLAKPLSPDRLVELVAALVGPEGSEGAA